MDDLRDCVGGGLILPDGTTVALENVEGMSRAVADLCKHDRDRGVRMLCACAKEIHEAGLPGLVPEYLARVRGAGATDEATARAILELGVALENADDLASAAACYAFAMDLPERSRFTWYFLHNNLGYCLNAQARFAEAFGHCLAAIRIDPTRYNAFKNLGISLQGLGRFEEAASCFRHACLVDPEDGRSRQHLADLLHGGRVDEVPDILVRRASTQRAGQRLMEARRNAGAMVGGRRVWIDNFDGMYLALADDLEGDPGALCAALGMLAWFHALADVPVDLERAADHIVAAGTPAEAAQALVSCAENLALIGRAAEALQLFARANALLPAADDFVRRYFHSRLASCLTRLSRCREAEAHYRESIRLDPWAASAHRGLGVALLARGDAAAAEREILIAEELSGQTTRRIAACCGGCS